MNTFLRFSPLLAAAGIVLLAFGLSVNRNKENVTNAEISYLTSLQKIDSLQNVINDLQAELESEEVGFDRKEQRYEDILFEYEYGIERLKETHPSAYKEFHRIIAFKERYSIDVDRDNKKRLSNDKF